MSDLSVAFARMDAGGRAASGTKAEIIAAIDQATAPLCRVAGGCRRLGEGIRRSAGYIRRTLGNAQVAAVLNYTLILHNITA